MWTMARKLRLSFSKRVASLRMSFILHEEPFDDIAHGVEIGVVRDRPLGVAFVRDDGHRAFVGDEPPDRACVISFIGSDGEGLSGAIEKARQDRAVMNLAAGDDKASGSAMFIDYRMNFTRAAAA
jgi:hypothetical protein